MGKMIGSQLAGEALDRYRHIFFTVCHGAKACVRRTVILAPSEDHLHT